MTVERVRAGEVLELQRRSVEVTLDESYEEIGIRSFGRGVFHKEPVSGATLGSKRVFHIRPGDLLLSNVFAWEGAIAVASEAEHGKIGSHRFMTYTPVGERIDTAWASWFFRGEAGLELIRQASPGSAGRNRTLAIDRFEALEIPLPPIDEQRRVAAHLDHLARCSAEASSGLNRQAPVALVRALPALVDVVIDDAVTTLARVSNLVAFVSDTVHPGDDPYPANEFVGLQHVESHTGRCIGSDPLGPMKGRKFRFRPGDILYGYLRPYLNKVWVADRHGLCSVDQYVLRPCDGTNAELLAHTLRGRRVLNRSIELTHSLQLPRLRSGLLGAIQVPQASGPSAAAAVRRLDVLRDTIVRAAALRARQEALAAALVPSALNAAFGEAS